MFAILINDILPVFAVLVLGLFRQTDVVSRGEATTLNRIAFILFNLPNISAVESS